MKADFSRQTFAKRKHYSGVLLQQGRVQVDADWNEQHSITQYRTETATCDIIGTCAAPVHNAGFEIRAGEGASFSIGAGRLYVDGMLCENEEKVTYTEQHVPVESPDIAELLDADQPVGLVYLDAWERHVSAFDDEQIREVALGGPDTATRKQVFWHVRVLPLDTTIAQPDAVQKLLEEQKEIATTLGDVAAGEADAEEIAELRADLRRVNWEITELAGLNCDAALERLREARALIGMLDARAQPPQRGDEPCLVPPGAGYTRLENQLYRVEIHEAGPRGTATFKWSRDNGSVVFPISRIANNQIMLRQLGRDEVLSIANGDWVEVVDDATAFNLEPGQLVRVQHVNPATRVVTVDQALPTVSAADARAKHYQLRRWDQRGEPADLVAGAVRTRGGFIPLEGGVEIQLTDAEYHSGDYWLIPARTATSDIEWPENVPQPPLGIQHHLCPLALVMLRSGEDLAVISDCRKLFPIITELTSFFYLGGDGQEAMPNLVQPGELLPLPQPLRVGVANGEWGVSGAAVRFTVVSGAGTVQGNAGVTDILTDAHGVATCAWSLDSTTQNQRVEATLIDGAGDTTHAAIDFSAALSTAAHVAYDPKGCAPLDGALTVQDAIDRLCDLGFREPGIHIVGLETVDPRDVLHNDSEMAIDTLLRGIRIACDAPVVPGTISQATCFVTLDRPLFLDQRHARVAVGYIPFILAGDLSVRGRIITWRPRKETVESLREQLPTLLAEGDRGILARLRLKGNVIWRDDERGAPELYVDGEAYGFRERDSQTTDLRLPSGDGVRGGDFEMWFWLFGGRMEPTGIGIIPNMKSVVLSRPEVRAGINLALDRERLRHELPEAYEVATSPPFDFARARELIGRQELPDRVIIASSAPNLERLTALIGHALTELDLGIEYGQRTVEDVVANARQTVESGHRLDMVVGDEGLAATLAAEMPGTFDGPFIRF